jgi:hypothetical protein
MQIRMAVCRCMLLCANADDDPCSNYNTTKDGTKIDSVGEVTAGEDARV